MTGIGYYRYEGFDLRTKFGWINGAAGLQATEPARIGMGNVGNAFSESDDAIRGLLAPLGLDWHGRAAEEAAGALARAAERAGTTSVAGSAGSTAVAGYGQSFEELRPKIAWQDPGSWDWWEMGVDLSAATMKSQFGDVFDVQSDYMRTVEENRTLEARANEALYSHEQVSRERLAAFPVVEPAAVASAVTTGGPGGQGGMVGATGYGDVTRFPVHDPSGTERVGTAPAGALTPPGAPPAVPVRRGSTPPGWAPPERLETAGAGGAGGLHATTNSATTNSAPPGGGPGVAGSSGSPLSPGSTGRTGTRGGPGGRGTQIGGPMPGRGSPPPAGPGRGGGLAGTGSSGGYGRGGSAFSGTGRGSTSGGEFGGRLPAGDSGHSGAGQRAGAAPGSTGGGAGSTGAGPGAARATGPAAGAHPPLMGGMGAGSGSGSTEHQIRYWIPSAEAFEVGLPPHTEAVIEGRDE